MIFLQERARAEAEADARPAEERARAAEQRARQAEFDAYRRGIQKEIERKNRRRLERRARCARRAPAPWTPSRFIGPPSRTTFYDFRAFSYSARLAAAWGARF